MEKSKNVLFVCVENASRSQMAEAFLRKYAPHFNVSSAGMQPNSELNSLVVKVMSEIGIDITSQKPKILKNEMITESISVNMGCMNKESHPSLFVKDVFNWNIPDPKKKSIDEIRKIRDQIKTEVMNLIDSFEGYP